MDPIEKKILENKDLFERPFTNENKLWKRIENELDVVVDNKKPKSYLSKIIGLLIFSLVALSAYLLVQNSKLKSNSYAEVQNQELQDINHHYGKQVAYEISQLEKSSYLSEEEKIEFLEYINELNKEQISLKSSLQENINNEEILDAIVQNFNQQITLINHLVMRLKNQENNTYEPGISM